MVLTYLLSNLVLSKFKIIQENDQSEGGLVSGCPNLDNAIQNTHDKISTTQTAAVRCCSFGGGSCKSKTPDCSKLTFSKAKQECHEFGMRLCTKKELASNICCATGCNFDIEPVWYTKGNMFCSNIKILMQPCPSNKLKEPPCILF